MQGVPVTARKKLTPAGRTTLETLVARGGRSKYHMLDHRTLGRLESLDYVTYEVERDRSRMREVRSIGGDRRMIPTITEWVVITDAGRAALEASQ